MSRSRRPRRRIGPRSPTDRDPERRWDRLEAERDQFRRESEQYRRHLFDHLAERAGMDSNAPEVQLLVSEFKHQYGHVHDPDVALERLKRFADEHGMLPH